jgi:hypothetical protein
VNPGSRRQRKNALARSPLQAGIEQDTPSMSRQNSKIMFVRFAERDTSSTLTRSAAVVRFRSDRPSRRN